MRRMSKYALKHDDARTGNHKELVLNKNDGQLTLKGKAKTNWFCLWQYVGHTCILFEYTISSNFNCLSQIEVERTG